MRRAKIEQSSVPRTLVSKPVVEFGYLPITVDLSTPQGHLTITFNDGTNTKTHDTSAST